MAKAVNIMPDGTLVVKTRHYEDVKRVLVEYGTSGTLFYADERPTGHWKKDIDNSRLWDRVRFYCSECGDYQTYGEADFCPHCGADCRGEK